MGKLEKAYFGGGCFWCTEAAFKLAPGVTRVIPGYAGGNKENPTYEEVCNGGTGHAEIVELTFDSLKISYPKLLEIFFKIHDPSQENRQGADVGTQYRSIILYTNEVQKVAALNMIKKLENSGDFARIYTEVVPLEKFWPAEKYHWDYFEKHPERAYCQTVIRPKLEKIKTQLN